jgi:hypothetical protein
MVSLRFSFSNTLAHGLLGIKRSYSYCMVSPEKMPGVTALSTWRDFGST